MGNVTVFTNTALEFCMIGWSFDAINGDAILFAGTQSGVITDIKPPGTATITTSPRTHGIGNLYYDAASGFDINSEHAEFIVFPRALTAQELEEVYERSLLRLIGREVPVSDII